MSDQIVKVYASQDWVGESIDAIRSTFVINVSNTSDGKTKDKTFAEILEAYEKGFNIIVCENGNNIYQLCNYEEPDDIGYSRFIFFRTPQSGSYEHVKRVELDYYDIYTSAYGEDVIYTSRIVDLDNSEYEALTTEDKTIIGAINELYLSKANADHAHSWNDLKDKPFGENIDLAEVESSLSNGTITLENSNPTGDNSYVISLHGTSGCTDFLSQSGTFYVKWDDVLYETQKRGYGGIGNEFLYDSTCQDTGEPFYMVQGFGVRYLEVYGNSIGTHTYTIYTGVSTVVSLDESYIPDTIARTADYYTKTEIDTIIGSYINDIDTLIGGES